MNQLSLTIPELQIIYDLERPLFKITFRIANPDRTNRDIAGFNPVFEIIQNGYILLSISGADITAVPENSQFIVQKPQSAFSGFDCMKYYTYRFYDLATDTVYARGPFKLEGSSSVPGPLAFLGVTSITGTAVNNDDPSNPVIDFPEPVSLDGVNTAIEDLQDGKADRITRVANFATMLALCVSGESKYFSVISDEYQKEKNVLYTWDGVILYEYNISPCDVQP